MKTTEHDDLIRFHAMWKERLKYSARAWRFVLFGALICGLGIFLFYATPISRKIGIVILCFSGAIFLYSLWIVYDAYRIRSQQLLQYYHTVMLAIKEHPENNEYHAIFLDFAAFIGLSRQKSGNKNAEILRRMNGSEVFSGESKHGGHLPAYQFTITLTEMTHMHWQIQHLVEEYSKKK